MTKEEALKLLEEADNGDPETSHTAADDVLCKLLDSLGYREVVDRYSKIVKWYA